MRSGPPAGRVHRPPPATEAALSARDRHRFYGRAAWKRARSAALRRNPLCARCIEGGAYTPAAHVHHRADLAKRPDLAFAADNLECLCHSCHSRETRYRQGIDDETRTETGPARAAGPQGQP